jgi:CBS domain-containing membrane protein
MALSFKPILAGADFGRRILACAGAAIGIGLTCLICALAPLPAAALPAIVAPLGASAVLVFAVPASPLAQPWPVIGGNMLSALIGITAARYLPGTALAAGVAVGGAILVMSLTRSLHPPGGAAALTAVIGGDAVREAGFAFALSPVALNSVVLVVAAIAFHRLTRGTYPHGSPQPARIRAVQTAAGIEPGDVDAALKDMHEDFDIAREDLDLLIASAQAHARARRLSS